LEQDLVLGRQAKIEKRMQRAEEAAQSVLQHTRHAMARSSKPRVIKKKVEEKVLTQEELDYMRYVEGLGEDKNHTSSQVTIGKQSKMSNK
jgi:hypothetical protein